MNKKTFKKKYIEAAVWNDTYNDAPLVLIEAMDWTDGGKYQQQENILQDTVTKLYYSYVVMRSGSYFSDYNYSFEWEKDDIELVEVAKVTETIEVWKAVN